MADANIEIVRQSYEAFARGDNLASLAHYHPDVEFSQPAEEPGGGTYHGPDAVTDAFKKWLSAWDDYRVDVAELRGMGEHVLATTRHHMRGKSSGLAVEQVIFQLWTLHDGKIVRVRMYYDEDQATADALGA